MSRTAARKPAYLALSCIGALASHPAFAKDATPAPADDEDPDRTLDIIVNGQHQVKQADPKMVAPLINTPRSIVVLSRDTIDQTGSNSLQDALRTVPGITFGAAEGGNPIGDRPFIRGFDSQGSIYVDGVRDLASQNREVFAIDSVQIVRGSDSTLGGRGSAGGTINILTKVPQLSTFGAASISYGNADYKRATTDLNVKLGDTAAFRIEGMWHDQSVAGRDAIWNNRWGVAPSITLGLGTPTRMTIGFYHMESHELPDSGIPYLNICSTVNCTLPAGNVFTTPAIGTVTTRGGQTGTVARSTFYGLADRDFRDTSSNQATLRVEHDFGGGITLRNTARFSHDTQAYIYTQPDDSQGNVFGTTTVNATNAAGGTNYTSGGYVWRRANTRYSYSDALIDQIDLSGSFATGSIKHSFAAGAEVSWEKARRGTYLLSSGSTASPRCTTATLARYYCASVFDPNPNDPYVNYASDTSTVTTPIVKGAANTETQNDANTVAVYAFDSITLLPQLILNLGVRYDRFQSKLTPVFAVGAVAAPVSRTDELFNWQAGVVFKPTKESSLYASYATAATPPNALLGEGSETNALPTAATTVAGNLDQLKVQKTKSYEVGAKANVFDEKLALAVAVFQTDIQNARVTIDANTVGYLGRTRIRGVELTASGVILPGWTVFGGYTFLDPKIVDGGNSALTAAAVTVGRVVVQAAKTIYVPSVNTGKQVPQTARNSFTATTNYEFQKGVLKGFAFGGSAIYMDRQYGGYADNRIATQNSAGVVTVTPATVQFARGVPDYWRFDARASYQLTPNIGLAINAQNLTDKVYFTQAYASHYATIAAGRTVFGTANFKF